MKRLRLKSRHESVRFLEEILEALGYDVTVSNYFGADTQAAILDFQRNHGLVIDGIVGKKTWSKLLNSSPQLFSSHTKFLKEQDLNDFATTYQLEIAIVKAVNEVESGGLGFQIDGRPRILFEGHIFWKQLRKHGFEPTRLATNDNQSILYKKWTKKYYLGGAAEYERLEGAKRLLPNEQAVAAAYESTSWGAFQIMGFHWKTLGYTSARRFVEKMHKDEGEHLKAFGKFLKVNNLIQHLISKDWAAFARKYNGPGFALNKYDTKLATAYHQYSIQNIS